MPSSARSGNGRYTFMLRCDRKAMGVQGKRGHMICGFGVRLCCQGLCLPATCPLVPRSGRRAQARPPAKRSEADGNSPKGGVVDVFNYNI